MNDVVAEKLVQKVINMLEEMSDLNIQVRRLTPSQETFNRINERIDAILGAIRQIENGISSDEKRIAELEKQTQLSREILTGLVESVFGLRSKAEEIKGNTYAIKQDAMAANSSNESRFQQLGELFGAYKVWLIALAVAQVLFFIVVLFK